MEGEETPLTWKMADAVSYTWKTTVLKIVVHPVCIANEGDGSRLKVGAVHCAELSIAIQFNLCRYARIAFTSSSLIV